MTPKNQPNCWISIALHRANIKSGICQLAKSSAENAGLWLWWLDTVVIIIPETGTLLLCTARVGAWTGFFQVGNMTNERTDALAYWSHSPVTDFWEAWAKTGEGTASDGKKHLSPVIRSVVNYLPFLPARACIASFPPCALIRGKHWPTPGPFEPLLHRLVYGPTDHDILRRKASFTLGT